MIRRDSWFAGHMTSEDEEKLEKAESGAFLVRFSDTDIDEGGFSLEVKHEDDIEKFAIRVSFISFCLRSHKFLFV